MEFLGKAIELGSDPAAVTGLMTEAKMQLPPRTASTVMTMLSGQLVARGKYAAVRYLAQEMPGGASRVIEQIALSSTTSDLRLAPLAWTFANDDAFENALDDKGGL